MMTSLAPIEDGENLNFTVDINQKVSPRKKDHVPPVTRPPESTPAGTIINPETCSFLFFSLLPGPSVLCDAGEIGPPFAPATRLLMAENSRGNPSRRE